MTILSCDVVCFWPKRPSRFKHLLYRPAITQSEIYRRSGYAKASCKLGGGEFLATDHKFLCVLSIVALLLICCPSTILLAVVAVIVNAVDRHSWRGRVSHVGVEVFKRLPENTYTSTPVEVECPMFRIPASLDDAPPNGINRVVAFPMRDLHGSNYTFEKD